MTIKYVFRHCQISPGKQNYPWLRTTDLENCSNFQQFFMNSKAIDYIPGNSGLSKYKYIHYFSNILPSSKILLVQIIFTV